MQVRIMHVAVRKRVGDHPEWDAETWGLPISQTYSMLTQIGGSIAPALSLWLLGYQTTPKEMRALMHFNRYMGHLLGVQPRWAPTTIRRDCLQDLTLTTAARSYDSGEHGKELIESFPAAFAPREGQTGLTRLRAAYNYRIYSAYCALWMAPATRKQYDMPPAFPWILILRRPLAAGHRRPSCCAGCPGCDSCTTSAMVAHRLQLVEGPDGRPRGRVRRQQRPAPLIPDRRLRTRPGETHAHHRIVEGWNGPGRRTPRSDPVGPERQRAAPRRPASWAFEHWYFDARLDSGHIVVGFIQKRRPRSIQRKPGRRAARLPPRRHPPARSSSTTRRRAFAPPREQCDVAGRRTTGRRPSSPAAACRCTTCTLSRTTSTFDLTFDQRGAHLDARRRHARRTATATTSAGASRRRAPASPARSRIDDETIEATGIGYHDHNWGVGDMKRIIDHWYWGRLYTDDFSVLYANVHTAEEVRRTTSRCR